MSETARPLTFTKGVDGAVRLVGDWHDRIVVSPDLLHLLDIAFGSLDKLTFKVENGTATYRRVKENEYIREASWPQLK